MFDMYAHKEIVTINREHKIVVKLPADFPQGEAELTIISKTGQTVNDSDLCLWLEEWALSLPTAPVVSLEAMDRQSIYR